MYRWLLLWGVAAVVLLPTCPASNATTERDEKAIADVASGKLLEARASWWGFDSRNATACLQAAISSGVPRLIVDEVGSPWNVDPITLRSNQVIVFERGVEVVARKGSFRGRADCLFSAYDAENITLEGPGATLRMRRDDYTRSGYERGEWRMVLSFRGCNSVNISGLTLADSGGDGIYLGSSTGEKPCVNVNIDGVTCTRHYRQGISVVNAENLLIENCLLRDTQGVSPQAGIDFEPNRANERLVNCLVRNCVGIGNAGNAFSFYLPRLTQRSEPVSIRLENCRSYGGRANGMHLFTLNRPQSAPSGIVEFDRCTFVDNARSGIRITDKPATALRVVFRHCTIERNAPNWAQDGQINFQSKVDSKYEIGGVDFEHCTIRDTRDRPPIAYLDRAGGLPLADITGSLTIYRDNRSETVDISEHLLGAWTGARISR